MANEEQVFIRAQVVGVLPSGQKRIQLLATGADGISFYTYDESLIPADDLTVVVHGQWIKRPDERICPFCNDRYSYFGGKEKNFCSNCGAKMDLKEE